jgi:hypothetical protein
MGCNLATSHLRRGPWARASSVLLHALTSQGSPEQQPTCAACPAATAGCLRTSQAKHTCERNVPPASWCVSTPAAAARTAWPATAAHTNNHAAGKHARRLISHTCITHMHGRNGRCTWWASGIKLRRPGCVMQQTQAPRTCHTGRCSESIGTPRYAENRLRWKGRGGKARSVLQAHVACPVALGRRACSDVMAPAMKRLCPVSPPTPGAPKWRAADAG